MSSNSKVADNQCPTCKSPLFYNAELQLFKCNYCGSEFHIEDLKNTNSTEETVDENYVTYNCPDCGATVIADENTAATFCLYCGNANILKNRLSGKFAPSRIIPFKVDKQLANMAFKDLRKGRPLVPKDFTSIQNIEKITGVYIPFWLFDVSVDGAINIEGTKTSSWIVGDIHYTKYDYYNVIRDGSMNFSMIPVDGSVKFQDDIMNTIEPFDYKDLVPYNHAYLSGFLAEKYDVTSEDAFAFAKKRALESAQNKMLNSVVGYSSKRVMSSTLDGANAKTEYVLLPVWMVNVKYQDAYYLFAMNGQTGEFVGNIPLDKKKAILMGIGIFLLCFIIVMIVSYIIYLGGAR